MRPALFAAVILVAGTALSGSSAPPWTLSLRSVGPVRVGSTIAEFRRAIGRDLAPGAIARDCGYAHTRDEEIYFYTRNGRIGLVSVRDGSTRTRSGIGIGSSVGDLQRAYRGQLIEGPGQEGTSTLLFVPRDGADQAYRISFLIDQGRVLTIDVGMVPDILEIGENSRCFEG